VRDGGPADDGNYSESNRVRQIVRSEADRAALGERPEDTVIREMHEELGITIKDACLTPFIFASHSYAEFHLLMPLFLCRRWEGIAQAREGQKVAWVRIKDLALYPERYPMPAADLPLIPLLRDLL